MGGSQPYRIGFFLVPEFSLMSYAACEEPLRAANYIAQETIYEMTNVSEDGGDIMCTANVPRTVRCVD